MFVASHAVHLAPRGTYAYTIEGHYIPGSRYTICLSRRAFGALKGDRPSPAQVCLKPVESMRYASKTHAMLDEQNLHKVFRS